MNKDNFSVMRCFQSLSWKIAVICGTIIFLFAETDSYAHKVTAVSVVSKFDTKARKYSIELAMDIYPSEDPTINDEVSPQQAADFFSAEALDLFFGDIQIEPQAKSELFKDPEADPEIQEVKVKVLVTLTGEIPKDAGNFTLRVSPDTTAAVVMVTFKDGIPGRRAEVLYPGEFSSPVEVSEIIVGDPFEGVEDLPAGEGNQESSEAGEERAVVIVEKTHSRWGMIEVLAGLLVIAGGLYWTLRRSPRSPDK